MKAKLTLPSGSTGFTNDAGQWVCTGSQMGRRNILPDDPKRATGRLRLQRLPFVDGCYDRWGAYWGSPANVWMVWGDLCQRPLSPGIVETQVFVRANSRDEAKAKVREQLPQARFYR